MLDSGLSSRCGDGENGGEQDAVLGCCGLARAGCPKGLLEPLATGEGLPM
jgi:hypothetical protein